MMKMIDPLQSPVNNFMKAFVLFITTISSLTSYGGNATWGANANTAWYTASNWAGGAYPGLQGGAASNTDISTFTSAFTGTTPGINMGTASLNLGAISIDNTRTTNLLIGNSSATAGSLRLYGATVNSVANVIVRHNGTGTFTLQAAQNGTMGVVLSNGTDNIINIDNTGGVIISSILSGTGKLTKSGSGSGILTLTGNNTYSGGTAVTSGELRLNPSANESQTGGVTLGGGTLSTTSITATRTITMGSLTLTDNTTLALGSNAHTLTFGASSGNTWTSGKMLTITGWTGTINAATSGTAGKVFVGSTASGLTCSQLAQVQFLISGTNYPALQLSTGELVPINTPTTTSISPTSATAGGSSFTLTVNGTNFLSGQSTVTWNGSTRTTTFVSATQLTATINAADIASSGTATVGVTTGCTASNTQTFSINPSCTTPSTAITGTTSGCGTVSLTATGATTYTWSTGNSTNTATNTFTTLGTYTVTVTGANGACTASVSTSITVASSTTSIAPTTTQNITTGANGTVLTVTEGTSSPASRQWYYGTASGGPYSTLISGATATTYTPNFGSVGTYYVVCQTTYGTPCSNTVTSNEVIINVTSNSITTGAISGSPFCQGVSGVTVPFTYSAASSFPTATFTAQLSDATGSFASPTTLQSVASDGSGSQSISVTIPSGATAGTAYRIRVVSNTPAVSGADNGSNLTINANPTLSITGTTTACATVSLTATGTGASYVWSGGSSTGTAANTFTSSGTYTVTSTLSGCTATASAVVTVNPNPTLSISGTTPGCTSVTLTASGTGASYAWSGGSTPSAASNTFTTSATYTVTSTLGSCTATASQAVSIVAAASISAHPSTGTQTVCSGSTLTALSVTASNAAGYQWYINTSNNNTTGTLISGATSASYTPSNTLIGTNYYYCIVSGNSPCVSVTSNVSGAITVNAIPADPTGTISASANPSCGASTLTFSGGAATIYWETAASGTSTANPTTSTYSLAATGTMYVRASVSGCWSVGTVNSGSVTINTAPAISSQPSTTAQTVCAGTAFSPTSVSVTASNATGYQWYVNTVANNTTGTLISGATTASYTLPATVGTYYYYCIISGNSPCASVTSNVSGAITVNALPADPTGTITASANPSCGAATLTYSAPSASIYWQTAATGTSTATPTTSSYSLASTGTIYARTNNGTCWSSTAGVVSSGAVTINTAVSISAQPASTTIVSGSAGSISVTATGAAGYQWEFNTGTGWSSVPNSAPYSGVTSATLSISAATTTMDGYQYRCVISATSPCTAVTSSAATLTVTTSIWTNAITATDPSADNPYITGDTKDGNLSSVSGIGRGTGISGAAASGRYSASGWTTATSINATDYYDFTLTPATGYLINFNSFAYTGQASGTGPASFSLRSSLDGYTASIGSPTATGATIGLSGGTYQGITSAITFRLYGYNAGAAAGTFSVNDFTFYGAVKPSCTTPTLSTAIQNGTACAGAGAVIDLTGLVASASNNTINYTINGVAQTAVTGVNASGTGTASFTTRALTTADNGMSLVITGITNNSCSATFSTAMTGTLAVNPLPSTPTFSGSASGCNSVSLTASSTGGSTYAWSGGSTPATAANTFTTSGTYTVTATLSGCTASASQAVTVTTSPTASISGTATGCTSVSLTASGGTTYAWSGGSTPATAANTFTTSGTYTVTVSNSCGSATATVAVTVNTPPATPTFSGTTTACTSVTLTASSTAGSTFAWSGGSTPAAATNTFTSSGTYTVTATRSGCTATASQAVTVNTATSITTQPSNITTGVGASATFSVTAAGSGLTYQWKKNGSNISGATAATYTVSPTALTDSGSVYSVVVTGTCGTVTSAGAVLSVINFVYQAGDYRSTIDYTDLSYNNNAGTTSNWEYFDGTNWTTTPSDKAPQNAATTPTRVIITKYVYGGGNHSHSYNDIIILSGGTLDLESSSTPTVDFIKSGKSLETKSGGNLFVYGQIQMNSSANLIVRSGGYMEMGSTDVTNSHVMWNGIENFEPGSEVFVGDWGFASSGAGSFMNVTTTITNNSSGKKFGLLDFVVTPTSSSWTIIGGGITVNLCDTLWVDNKSASNVIGMTSNTGSPNVTVGRFYLYEGIFALSACYSGSATQTVNITENAQIYSGSTLKLFHNGGGTAGNIKVNLAGNLVIDTLNSVINDATTDTGAVFNFNGTATQLVDITPTVTAWPMNINSGATVSLVNHSLNVNSNTSRTSAFTVKNGGTLDFGFAADNLTANVIKKVTSGATGTNTFATEQNTTLKITSPDGIQQASSTLGNVQMASSNKTFNQLATFWYTGHANQVTGDALGTGSNGKQLIIDLLNKSLSVTLTQSTGLSNATTISATGGKLDIRKGQFLESATAYIIASTGTLTMAAGTLYQIPALSSSSSDLIPRMDGVTTAYTLNGGTIELSGAGAQTLRGNRTYYNVKFSGSNIYGTNYKNLSTDATINDSLIVTGANTVVNCVDASANAISFSGDGGLVMDGGRIMIKSLNSTQPVLTGITIPYSLTGGTVEFYGSNASTQQALRATDGNGNTISYYNMDINADAANTTAYNVNPTASFGIKGNFNVYSPAVFQLDETDNISGTGNFAINAGATFKYGSANGIKTSGTGTSDGNIRISGTRTFSTSASYGFIGNGDMVSGNGLPSSMVNMYVQKSGTSDVVTLSGTATATGTIAFTKGRISTGTNELVSSNTSTTSITGHGLNKYVIGNLRRYVAASGSYDFPVGNTSYYDLGTIDFNSQSGVTSLLGFFNTGQSGTAPATSTCQINGSKIDDYLNNGFWTFTPNSTMTSGTYDVTLNAMGYSNAPSLVTRMGVIKRANASSPWLGCGLLNGAAQSSAYGTHSNATQSITAGVATAVRTGVTGFSDFGIGIHQTNTPLPVTLMYLTATPVEDRYIALEWATASEINNSGFQVERSIDGVTFEPIAWIDGHGNSNNTIKYNTDDHQVATGIIYYYRLKQVDYDGKSDYSNIVSATLSGSQNGITIHNIYPNPASAQVTIDIVAATEQPVSVSFTDMLGREVLAGQWQLSTGFNDRKYDISSLADGVYHVTVKAGNSFFTKVLAVTK